VVDVLVAGQYRGYDGMTVSYWVGPHPVDPAKTLIDNPHKEKNPRYWQLPTPEPAEPCETVRVLVKPTSGLKGELGCWIIEVIGRNHVVRRHVIDARQAECVWVVGEP
jgi:hypothetical protein